MPDQKEMEDFAVRLAGAFAGALEDSAIEGYFIANVLRQGLQNVFPYISIDPNLPPVDDLLVGGLALPPWVIGMLMEEDAKKKGDSKTQQLAREIRIFGEGDVCYSIPMLLYTTLARVTQSYYDPQTAARVGQPTVNRPVEQGRPAGQIVLKL